MDNFNTLVSGGFEKEDLVGDGWTDIIRNILLIARLNPEEAANRNPIEMMQLADFKKMEQIRARVDSVVQDEATAAALKPWYNQFCKRPCFHDEYLETFNRPNVTLVDTDGKGVERITETGVVANGKAYEIDCLIYATGFEVGTGYTRASGYDVFGCDGRALSEKWKGGVSTFHGIFSYGFPNLFIVSQTQSGFSVNFPHMIGEQARHIAHIIAEAGARQATRVETTKAAEDAWVQTIIDNAIMRQRFLEECTPGYYNNEGNPSALAARNGPYGLGSIAFIRLLQDWREAGKLEGLALS